MAGISRHNKAVLDKGFKDYKKYILDTAEKELTAYCNALLYAAIIYREQNLAAHNFTGNLLNSIVVCLYRESKPVIAFFSSSVVKGAIRPKMTRGKSYYFDTDYDGRISEYKPEIATDEGWGAKDAEKFFESYKPKGGNLFDIAVAYTVEYAEWIEIKRQTTGIINSYGYAKNLGLEFMQLSA